LVEGGEDMVTKAGR
jgi:hypothetical protein